MSDASIKVWIIIEIFGHTLYWRHSQYYIRQLESVAQLGTDVEIVISHSEVDEWTGNEC